MLTFRTFRNSDPPVIAALWRSREGQPGLLQPISTDLLEQLVFARTYFDPRGLILAFDGERPVGFAHAGFGANADGSWIGSDAGVICMVLTRPDCDESAVAAGLVARCEEYFRGRGVKCIYGGGLHPWNPFYVGLYGGSELPGVLDSDAITKQTFIERGYAEAERLRQLHCELSGFEPIIDRRQMQIRRQMVVEVIADAPAECYWDAATLCEFDLTQFDLVSRAGGPQIASVLFRSMEPVGSSAFGKAIGWLWLHVEPTYRHRGLAFFLLSEAFRQFIRQGITRVDVQLRSENTIADRICQRFGFQESATGTLWKKELS